MSYIDKKGHTGETHATSKPIVTGLYKKKKTVNTVMFGSFVCVYLKTSFQYTIRRTLSRV